MLFASRRSDPGSAAADWTDDLHGIAFAHGHFAVSVARDDISVVRNGETTSDQTPFLQIS